MRPFRCKDGDIAVIIYDTPSCSVSTAIEI